MRGEFFVSEQVVGDASGIRGGVVEEFVPAVCVGLEAELLRSFGEGAVVVGWRRNFAFDYAPVAGILTGLQTKFAEAEPVFCAQFFNEGAKHKICQW